MNKYDVCIVGAGPAGIFTALELLEKSPGLNILMLDKGKPVEDRSHEGIDLTQGFGGCGSWSDGKLCLSMDAEYGGHLQEYVKDLSLFAKIMQKVDDVHMHFSDNKDIKLDGDNDEIADAIKMDAGRKGMHLLRARVRHLGTDNNEQIMKNIYEFIKDKVDIKFGMEFKTFKKIEDGFEISCMAKDLTGHRFSIANPDDVATDIFKSKYLVLMPGRGGNGWFSRLAVEHGFKIRNNQVDVGVRVEFPEWIGREIGEALYEPKLVFRTPKTDMKARTFCWNNGGYCVSEKVVDERNNATYLTVNGHSFENKAKKTPNSNFALLVSANFTEPFKDPISYGRNIVKNVNDIAGGTALVQRLKDAKQYKRSTEKRMREINMQPTLKNASPGNIALALPGAQWATILEALEMLDRVFPGLNGDDTVLYAPEVKWYSARAEMSPKLESPIPNLFCGGDGAGISRGIVQAAMCGIIIGEEIASRVK